MAGRRPAGADQARARPHDRDLHDALPICQAFVPTMPFYPAELLAPHDLQQATALYNGQIHPLHPFALRGAIWYQGESNSTEGMLYADHMRALISGWRQVWG